MAGILHLGADSRFIRADARARLDRIPLPGWTLCLPSSVDGSLGRCYLFALGSNCKPELPNVSAFVAFGYTLDRVVILPNFPRNRRTIPHSGDTMVHPRQRGTRVPISTHPARPFSSCFSFVWFLKVTILRGVRWHLTVFFPFSHD